MMPLYLSFKWMNFIKFRWSLRWLLVSFLILAVASCLWCELTLELQWWHHQVLSGQSCRSGISQTHLEVKGQSTRNVFRKIRLLWTLPTHKHTVSCDWCLKKHLGQSDDISQCYRCSWLCVCCCGWTSSDPHTHTQCDSTGQLNRINHVLLKMSKCKKCSVRVTFSVGVRKYR